MKKGLFYKIFMTYIIIICASFALIALILSFWFKSYFYTERDNQLVSELPFIENATTQYLSKSITVEQVGESLNYISSYINCDLLLVDQYGFVYATSSKDERKLEGTQILSSEFTKLMNGKTIEGTDEYSNVFKKGTHTFIKPLTKDGFFIGAVLMNIDVDQIRDPLIRVYVLIWSTALVLILVSCFFIHSFSHKIIIKPILEINSAAEKISKGEADKRVNIKSYDEIGQLANSFNLMADSLENVENNRKSFISNVSHELRSPITSIKGFIAGIMDGVIPPEKEKYYLSIVYEEIQRLTRLINEILDLSAIESGHLKLNYSTVDANEIVRRTVIKFENSIKDKNIKVDVLLSGEILLVFVDRDRLIQIVTNLLDNAVKYVEENGNIKITTKEKGQKVYVSVFNNGPSINEEDLKHIWDRFYRAEKSRTSKQSTGLGLPIIRNILTQMNENIWIENKDNYGVTFIFTLRKLSRD